MIDFLRPRALLWILLAVPVVVFYLRSLRARRRAVGTGFLWRQVFSDGHAGSAWRRWRRPVSLAVQLTLLAMLVCPCYLIPGGSCW